MRKIFILALLFFTAHLFAAGDNPMVLVYNIETKNSWIGIPIGGITTGGSVTIDWGDGTDTTVADTGFFRHNYSNIGIDTIRISGDLTRFGLYRMELGPSLISVLSWGDLPLTSLSYAFYGAKRLVSVPATLHSTITDLSSMFSEASSFNGDISNWDVSKVTDMNNMFSYASSFNGDISNWDVSNVREMSTMFFYASVFNSDISNWDVSKVTYMSTMFASAVAFNSDLSNWDVSNVKDMSSMFHGASVFNSDLSSWDVSKVGRLRSMFYDATSFNSDLSSWNISNVLQMGWMFSGASVFNSDLSSWDVSNVDHIRGMFSGASAFNSDLSNWDVSKVTDMSEMFEDAHSFNSDLSSWDVSNVVDMSEMLDNSALSVANYDKVLKRWEAQNLQKNVTLSAIELMYSSDAKSERKSLVDDDQWTIKGDSLVETTHTVTYDENYPGGVASTTEQFSPVAKYVSPSYFPKREGYKLVGWNSKLDGSGYAFDNTIKITEDITFYAQWVKGTAIIQTDTTTLTGVKGLLVSPNPVPQSEEKVTLVIPSDLSGSWKIGVYDVLGNELDDATFEAQGGTTYEWDLRNKSGAKVGGGSYVIMAEHSDDLGNIKTFRRTVGVAR